MSPLTRNPGRQPATGRAPAPQHRGHDLITADDAGTDCTPTATNVGGAR
jgi:hypothetical protein